MPPDPVRSPAAHDSIAELPWALTFFLTADERRAVLRALRQLHADRSRALLLALGVSPAPQASPVPDEGGAR